MKDNYIPATITLKLRKPSYNHLTRLGDLVGNQGFWAGETKLGKSSEINKNLVNIEKCHTANTTFLICLLHRFLCSPMKSAEHIVTALSVCPDSEACPEHNSKVNEAKLMKLCIHNKYVKAECSVQ